MLQPHVILKTLSQAFQIIVREAVDALRMDQPSMLRKSRRRIHYNVKACSPDLPNRGAADHRSTTRSFAWELASHGLGRFLWRRTEKHRYAGWIQSRFSRFEDQIGS